ncbi:MAG: hypothetical protein ACKVWR_16385 [Acidimicrobiales bacterium]
MSSIWTPRGEHPVPPEGAGDELSVEDLSPEEQAQLAELAEQVAETRRQVAAAPAESVVANHLIGLYELAAIHLGQETPNLPAARLAIDALAAVLDRLAGRLGEAEATLVEARSQIQLAFVAVSERSTA